MKAVKKILATILAVAVMVAVVPPAEVKADGNPDPNNISIKYQRTDWYTVNLYRDYADYPLVTNPYSFNMGTSNSLGLYIRNGLSDQIQVSIKVVDKNSNNLYSDTVSVVSEGTPYVFNGVIDAANYTKITYDEICSWLKQQGYTNIPATLNIKVEAGMGNMTVTFTNVELPESSSDSTEEHYIDYDTYKSELPSHTILAALSNSYNMDLKAHTPSEATSANQSLLADDFAKAYSKTKNILWSWDIYPRRSLSLTENGGKYNITINTRATGQAGTVYMECYSPEDKAYTLVGTMDDKGVATFDNFILRPATSVTIFNFK